MRLPVYVAAFTNVSQNVSIPADHQGLNTIAFTLGRDGPDG